ncbi:MAG: NAD(P)H-dependent glycerol-3-phosphate dehydrogenase [Actinobacteria bacterium]|nr:NAD(P)H-dependent glycerol-3-phosphate dehydrogenase [Actinomycetota bacterium]MBU1944403.1 NAD(P)H-dependent glycerol-3-phosphate dehydrogenase [Actinomycetota bacterium]MBU2688189.1 NAD(P)H-dependent glycerol-3-phosphate dehydrogenase [Actinomycetota bacterium]
MRSRSDRTRKDTEAHGELAVIGAGAWGSTLAALEAGNFTRVNIYTPEADVAEELLRFGSNERYLGEYRLPRNVFPFGVMGRAVEGAEMVLVAVPSSVIRQVARAIKPMLTEHVPVVLATKGLETGSGLLSLEVWRQELATSHRRGTRDAMVLSGPNLASELRAGRPALSLLAGTDPQTTAAAARRLCVPSLSLIPHGDPLGAQAAGALKNVYAVACGIASGLSWGDNALGALIWRGLAETSSFAEAVGGEPEVALTPAGVGDFVATCCSPLSRNHDLGRTIAGMAPGEEVRGVREGAQTAREAARRARSLSLDLPLLEAVWAVMEGAERPAAILDAAIGPSAGETERDARVHERATGLAALRAAPGFGLAPE